MRKIANAAFSFSTAIFVSHYLIKEHRIVLYFAAASAAAALSCLFLSSLIKKRALIILLSLSAGFLWSYAYTTIFVAPVGRLDGQTLAVTAVVLDYPSEGETSFNADIKLRLDGAPDIRARLYYYGNMTFNPGDIVDFTARFKRTDITEDGGSIDALVSRGILLSAYSSGDIIVTGSASKLLYFPQYLSNAVSVMCNDLFSDDISPFMRALLTGRRDKLNADAELSTTLSVSGISHVVAVSGMHLAFIVGLLGIFIRRKRLFAAVTIPALLVFMAMTGFTPSVTRAGIMQIFLLIAPLLRRESDGITSLSAALLVLLAVNPYSCVSVGLQLSFAASLGIILFAGRIDSAASNTIRNTVLNENKLLKPMARFVISGLAATAGAMVFTVPLTAVHFGYISLVAPLTNLLTLWAVSIAFSGGLIACILGFILLPLGSAASYPVALAARYITGAARWLAGIPHAAVYVSNKLIIVWLVYVYAMLIALAAFRVKKIRILLYPGCLSVISLCIILLITPLGTASADCSVTVLDVGQGQSVVISDGGYTAIVDCGGGNGSAAGTAAVEHLAAQGITSIDLLILTHFHADHINGAEYLLSRIDIAALAIPDPEGSFLAGDIISFARKRGTDIIYVTQTLSVALGGSELTLYPPLDSSAGADENERGLVVLCTGGGVSALITGDMADSAERSLLRFAALPDIDLLVAGHHGSRHSTSEELLTAVTPELAVISVGRNNYGHPSGETLGRLEEYGIVVFRTDLDGTVTISTQNSEG